MIFGTKKKAFTLIELLIVVAIIGILAAIAVPNFLNAQVRAKVARVLSDLRTITQAMEMYRLDCNSYINASESNRLIGSEPDIYSGLLWLTKLNYMGSIPQDPFESLNPPGVDENNEHGIDAYEVAVAPMDPAPIKKMYNINSRGPDQDEDMGERGKLQMGAIIYSYTPSNGLRSNGDIYLFGGDPSVMIGTLYIDRVKYAKSYPKTPRF